MEQAFIKLQGYMETEAASPSSHQSAHGSAPIQPIANILSRCPFATETDLASAQSLLSLAGQPAPAEVALATTRLLSYGSQGLDSLAGNSTTQSTAIVTAPQLTTQNESGETGETDTSYTDYARQVWASMERTDLQLDEATAMQTAETEQSMLQSHIPSGVDSSDLSALEEAIAVDPMMLALMGESHSSLHSPDLPKQTMIVLLDITSPQLVDCNQAALDQMQAPSISFARYFNPMRKLHLDVPLLVRAREALLSGRARQAHIVRRLRRPDDRGVFWMETMLTLLNNPERPGLVLGVSQPASVPLDGRANVRINGEMYYNVDPYAGLDASKDDGCIEGLCTRTAGKGETCPMQSANDTSE
jgi:hypothetical protein